MSLRLEIEEKFKEATRNKNSKEINTYRLIKSAIKDKDIESRTKDNTEGIDDKQILTLLQNLIKQRKDSIESFKAASREDLVVIEQAEIEIISKFLPQQLDINETEKLIFEIINSNKYDSLKDMGKIMNEIKNKHAGSVDMGLVGKIAKSKLAK